LNNGAFEKELECILWETDDKIRIHQEKDSSKERILRRKEKESSSAGNTRKQRKPLPSLDVKVVYERAWASYPVRQTTFPRKKRKNGAGTGKTGSARK